MPTWSAGKGSVGVSYSSKQGDTVYLFLIGSQGSSLVNETTLLPT